MASVDFFKTKYILAFNALPKKYIYQIFAFKAFMQFESKTTYRRI